MQISKIDKTKKLIGDISFKFSKISKIQKYLDVVFVFGSADDTIRVSEKTNKFYGCIVKFFPKLAPTKKTYSSQRKQFLKYTQEEKPHLNFVTIEKLYEDLKKYGSNLNGIDARRTKLVELELKAIEQSYSLIVFPESVGSYAELGYFTALEHTLKKIYVVNHYQFTGHNSYLNHLVDVIHNKRDLRPMSLDFYSDNIQETQRQYDEIIDNLVDKYQESKYKNFQKTDKMLPLAVLYELLTMFPNLTFSFLYERTNYILKNVVNATLCSKDDFSAIISLLVVSGHITRKEMDGTTCFEVINKENNFFIYDDFDEKELIIVERVKIEYGDL